MTRSFPRVCMFFFWSPLNPRPNPTRMITEAIPHTMPNMVRKVRILWARNVENAWRRISDRVMESDLRPWTLDCRTSCLVGGRKQEPRSDARGPTSALLQYYLLAFL